ncbi:MAG: hypothetical protein Q4D94_01865 [Bacillota bacterium]|nr:hypothetical protein [Bacillota bacterium]
MDNEKKRITITIPLEKEEEIEELKKEKFRGKSNSELFRYLMKEGLSASSGQEQEVDLRNFK